MTARVALINAPWGRIYCPSMGLGLIKARLLEAGIACDVLYWHLDWYAWLRDELSDSAAARLFDLGTESEPFGEWVFAAARFGPDDPGLREIAERYCQGAASEAQRTVAEELFSLGPMARDFVEDRAGAPGPEGHAGARRVASRLPVPRGTNVAARGSFNGSPEPSGPVRPTRAFAAGPSPDAP